MLCTLIMLTLHACASLRFTWKDCGGNASHIKVHNMAIEPANATIGDRIKITTMSTLDKHTTDIKCDVAMASKYHRAVDFCKGNSQPFGPCSLPIDSTTHLHLSQVAPCTRL